MRQSCAHRRRYDDEQTISMPGGFIFIAAFGLILHSLLPGMESGGFFNILLGLPED